jgi:hypothetical protein
MNWDRGFKRITLVLSVLSAIVGAVIGVGIALHNLEEEQYYKKRNLENELRVEFSEIDGQLLINKWKQDE